ncbi:uncharacterized protein LOC126838676 [Adelges cooleyi]|uniref:uncharacterized protein LOC126838676 n=1 Tax=Adelges cooleyi TaxID=133065 RepID=UPI00217FB380|nr:uncharacterized protein LOC126838676 [Adelges cooleyi]
MILRTCAVLVFIAVDLSLYGGVGAQPTSRSICETCACSPPNATPVMVNCTCVKTKFLIIREQDTMLLSGVRDLTLAGCGLVSLPSSGLSGSPLLSRVTVRDMKLFHYTAGLFPALESLTVEDVGGLVLDGFGPANRTLKQLVLRRTSVQRLVRGTIPASAPLQKVMLDRVDVDEIEAGALDMTFVRGESDGFSIVNSAIKTIGAGGVLVRSGSVKIINSTMDELYAGSVIVEDAKDIRLSGNRLGNVSLVGDSLSVVRSPPAGAGASTIMVDSNEFMTLPADLQLFKTDRSVSFINNVVRDVDLGPFLFGVGPNVRVSNNQFECDCDSRRISVLKLNQVFPGLLPEADDSRFAGLLVDNYCKRPNDMSLAGYRDELVAGKACPGTTLPTAPPTPSTTSAVDTNDASNGLLPSTWTTLAITGFCVVTVALSTIS